MVCYFSAWTFIVFIESSVHPSHLQPSHSFWHLYLIPWVIGCVNYINYTNFHWHLVAFLQHSKLNNMQTLLRDWSLFQVSLLYAYMVYVYDKLYACVIYVFEWLCMWYVYMIDCMIYMTLCLLGICICVCVFWFVYACQSILNKKSRYNNKLQN